MDKPFTPTGPAILVNGTATQIGNLGYAGNCFFVVNLANAVQHFTTGATSSVTSVGAPSAGTPSAATVGMAANASKVFSGLGPWMIASSSTGFEVIPGDGL